MPMPSGRQPGELAGWTPLAGEMTQQRLQEQREALNQKEQLVQGLGSRDDAAAYLQQLQHQPAGHQRLGPQADAMHMEGHADDGSMPHLTRAVDDSAIERTSTFKQLASWGGFRRHFKGEEGGHSSPRSDRGDAQTGVGDQERAADGVRGRVESRPPADWKLHLQEQLLAKRAEIMATQQKLESLSLEQQALERLFSSAP